MPRPVVVDTQAAFTGLNTYADPAHLKPTEVSQAVNAKLLLSGGVTPRGGTRRATISALGGGGLVAGLYVWPAPPSNAPVPGNPYVMAIASSGLYQAPYTANLATGALNFTNEYGGGALFVGSPQVSMVQFTDASGNDVIYLADGVNVLRKYNIATSTVTALSGTPVLSNLCVYNQRLIGISSGQSALLYWSSLNSGDDCGVPSTPGAGGNAVITTFAQGNNVGIFPFSLGLVITQQHGISLFTGWGQNDMSIETGTSGLSADIGGLGPLAGCAVENFLILATDRGVYVVTPYGFLQQISQPIENLWTPAVSTQGYFPSYPPYTVVWQDPVAHQVYFAAPIFTPTGATNTSPSVNTILAYNYRTSGWSGPFTFAWAQNGINIVTATGGFTGPAAGNQWFNLLGCSDGYIRVMDLAGLGQDDVAVNGTGGLPYQMQVTTRPLVGQGPTGQPLWMNEKAFRYAYVQAELQNPLAMGVSGTVYPAQGQALVMPQVQPGIYTAQPDPSPRTYRVQMGGRGQSMALTITDTPVSNPNGQNVYSGAGMMGFDMGPNRF